MHLLSGRGREAREFLENSKVAYDSLIGSLGQWLRVLEASDGASVSELVTRSLCLCAVAGHHASSGPSVSLVASGKLVADVDSRYRLASPCFNLTRRIAKCMVAKCRRAIRCAKFSVRAKRLVSTFNCSVTQCV